MTESRDAGVLFADISDSAGLYSSFGVQGASQIATRSLELMHGNLEASGGTIVDQVGDEILVRFSDAATTARAAIHLQHAVADARKADRLPRPFGVRIGFAYGPTLIDNGRLFGETLYTAHRVCALAGAHQIMTTGETLKQLPADLQKSGHFVSRTVLKGYTQASDIHLLVWDDAERTHLAAPPTPERDAVLDVWCGDRRITVDEARPAITIGRSPQCTLVINADDVSRVHARVEYRQGAFVVIDTSANGTLLENGVGDAIALRRTEAQLAGDGRIQVSLRQDAELRFAHRGPTGQGGDRRETGVLPP